MEGKDVQKILHMHFMGYYLCDNMFNMLHKNTKCGIDKQLGRIQWGTTQLRKKKSRGTAQS